jgi:hypothetical protein
MLWVRISIRARCTTLCDKACQRLATGRWFSPGHPISSTNKTGHHDITEILLKVASNKQTKPIKKINTKRQLNIDWENNLLVKSRSTIVMRMFSLSWTFMIHVHLDVGTRGSSGKLGEVIMPFLPEWNPAPHPIVDKPKWCQSM